MIEMGDPRVGPPKLKRGDRFGGWEVLRSVTPERRSRGRGRYVYQRRVLVQCRCGRQKIAWERDLVRGYSLGCTSKQCQEHRALDAVQGRLNDARERLAAVQRMVAETGAEVDQLEAKVAAHRARIAAHRSFDVP